MANILGDLLEPVLGAFGVNAAGDEQRKYLNAAMGRLKQGFGEAKGFFDPIYGGALGTYQDQLKHFGAGEFDPTKFNFQEDPGFRFALGESQEALKSRAGGEGMGHSPLTTQALMRNATDFANQYYNQAWNRNLAGQQARFGMGQQLIAPMLPAAGQLAGFSTDLGRSLADIEAQKGGISGQIAAAPFAAGQAYVRSSGGQDLLAQLFAALTGGH